MKLDLNDCGNIPAKKAVFKIYKIVNSKRLNLITNINKEFILTGGFL